MKGKLLFFVLGLVLGLVVALALPPLVAPWLPAGMGDDDTITEGLVVAKRLQDDRLLLTIESDQGATLATFTQRVPEIDLLVEEGDRVALGGTRYEPFIEDPQIRGVQKAAGLGLDETAEGAPVSALETGDEALEVEVGPDGEVNDDDGAVPDGQVGDTPLLRPEDESADEPPGPIGGLPEYERERETGPPPM